MLAILPAESRHAEAAARLALMELDAERAQLCRLPPPPMGAAPALPPAPTAEALAAQIAELFSGPYAAVALENDALVGYLAFEGPIEGFFATARGAYSPLHGCAAVGPRRARVLEALLAHVSARMAADGVTSIALTRFAHDADARESLTMCGFGVRCADALRPLAGGDARRDEAAPSGSAPGEALRAANPRGDASAFAADGLADRATVADGLAPTDHAAIAGAAAAADVAAVADAAAGHAGNVPSPLQAVTDALAAGISALADMAGAPTYGLGAPSPGMAGVLPAQAARPDPPLPEEIVLRELSWRDAGVLLPLKNGLSAHLCEAPVFFPASPFTAESFAALCARRQSRFLAAFQGERPVAYLELGGGGENYLTDQPGVMNICGMYAVPELRHLGVAGALANRAAAVARDAGAAYLGVDCETLNLAARHFWAKRFTSYTYSYHRILDDRAVPQGRCPCTPQGDVST